MAEEGILTWAFPLGAWVRYTAYDASAVFVIAWREYRETPWGAREQYGLMDLVDIHLDLREHQLRLEVGCVDELTSFDDDPDGRQHTALLRKLHPQVFPPVKDGP